MPGRCEEVCGICIDLDGKSRTGPSLCYQDYYLAPLYVLCVVLLLARRAKALNELAQADEPLKYYQRKDFILVGVAVLYSLYGLIAVQGGDSAEDNTVIRIDLLCFPRAHDPTPAATVRLCAETDAAGAIQTLYYGATLATWAGCMAVMVAEAHRKKSRGAELKIIYMLNTLMQLFRFRIGLLHMTFMEEDDTGVTSGSRAWADTVAFFLGLAIAIAGLMEPAGNSDRNAYGEMTEEDAAGAEKVLSSAEKAHPCGEHNASWMSQMLFEWLTPMLKEGKEHQLTDAELFALLPADTSNDAGDRLLKTWLDQLTHNPEDPSLFQAMKDVWWGPFLLAGFFKLINDSVVFVGPLLLQSLVQFVENPKVEDRSMVDGALLAIGIFVAKTIESIAVNQYFHVGYRIGGQLRAAITMLVYRKYGFFSRQCQCSVMAYGCIPQ